MKKHNTKKNEEMEGLEVTGETGGMTASCVVCDKVLKLRLELYKDEDGSELIEYSEDGVTLPYGIDEYAWFCNGCFKKIGDSLKSNPNLDPVKILHELDELDGIDEVEVEK